MLGSLANNFWKNLNPFKIYLKIFTLTYHCQVLFQAYEARSLAAIAKIPGEDIPFI